MWTWERCATRNRWPILCPLTFVDMPEQAYSRAMLGLYQLTRVELLRDLVCRMSLSALLMETQNISPRTSLPRSATQRSAAFPGLVGVRRFALYLHYPSQSA